MNYVALLRRSCKQWKTVVVKYWRKKNQLKNDGKNTLKICTTDTTQWITQCCQNLRQQINRKLCKTLCQKRRNLLLKSKDEKAPGIDRITAEMIQAAGNNSVSMMHHQCNKVYEDKKCRKDWGKAIIVPLHKKNDKEKCSNYRCISLLSIPGKI